MTDKDDSNNATEATESAQVSDQKDQVSEKEVAAKSIVSKYTGWGAGAGAIPVPVWDILAIGSVQVMMLKELYQLYGVEFSEKKARSAVTLLLGSLSPSLLLGVTATTLFKFVPGVGSTLAAVTLPILASASTYAVGKVMTGHLEEGGNLDDFDAKEHKEAYKETVKEASKSAKPATA